VKRDFFHLLLLVYIEYYNFNTVFYFLKMCIHFFGTLCILTVIWDGNFFPTCVTCFFLSVCFSEINYRLCCVLETQSTCKLNYANLKAAQITQSMQQLLRG
jgi:hypothetical protein